MPKNISLSEIKKYKNKFLKNNKNTASRNALIKNDLNTIKPLYIDYINVN